MARVAVRWARSMLAWALVLKASPALADAPPVPGRPEWDDTPMPMPSDPEVGWVALAVFLAVVAIAVYVRRRTS